MRALVFERDDGGEEKRRQFARKRIANAEEKEQGMNLQAPTLQTLAVLPGTWWDLSKVGTVLRLWQVADL